MTMRRLNDDEDDSNRGGETDECDEDYSDDTSGDDRCDMKGCDEGDDG